LQTRFIRTAQLCVRHLRNNSTTLRTFTRDTVNGFFTTAHHTLMISGVAALCTLAVMFYRPDLAHQLKSWAAFGSAPTIQSQNTTAPRTALPVLPATPDTASADAARFDAVEQSEKLGTPRLHGNPREQQWVTNWLSKRYRVATDATDMLVSAAYLTAKDINIDPLLILAVVAIESGFNPFAESAVGAQGLMQVMSKVHHEKFQELGGVKAALNPVANIRVGSVILKDYVSRGGSVEAGLKMYVGAAAFDNDAGYGSKVLAEYHRLKAVANGKNVPVVTSPAPVALRNQNKQFEEEVRTQKTPAAKEEQASVSEDGFKVVHQDRIAAM
jgi:soluble lytic murein transglycosylase-like protein